MFLAKGAVVKGTLTDFMPNESHFVRSKGTYWVDVMAINIDDGITINAQTLSFDKKSTQDLKVWEEHEFKVREFSQNTYTLDWIKPILKGSAKPAAPNEITKTALMSARASALSSAVNYCSNVSKALAEPFEEPQQLSVDEVLEIADKFLNWIKK